MYERLYNATGSDYVALGNLGHMQFEWDAQQVVTMWRRDGVVCGVVWANRADVWLLELHLGSAKRRGGSRGQHDKSAGNKCTLAGGQCSVSVCRLNALRGMKSASSSECAREASCAPDACKRLSDILLCVFCVFASHSVRGRVTPRCYVIAIDPQGSCLDPSTSAQAQKGSSNIGDCCKKYCVWVERFIWASCTPQKHGRCDLAGAAKPSVSTSEPTPP